METVEDAVILAGGMGTRMLPASRYTPKEVLPLLDTPILNHLIWESIYAGVKRIHLVLSPLKNKILNELIDNNGDSYKGIRSDLPRIALNPLPEGIKLIFHTQKHRGGVGEAISVALKGIKGPFLVLLGDNILMDKFHSPVNSGPKFASTGCKKLVERFLETNIPCAGIKYMPDEELVNYGVVELNNNMICQIIEKPDLKVLKSNYILCGRYLLPGNYEEILNKYPVSKYGELQSIATFEYFIQNGGFSGVRLDNFEMYDSGDPMTWLKSQIRYTLKREGKKSEFAEWVKKILNE
jgi:UTP--glucose-1-phosphate uridylyltransferase